MINQEQLDRYRERAKELNTTLVNSTEQETELVVQLVLYPELVTELLKELQEVVDKNNRWANYFKPKGNINK